MALIRLTARSLYRNCKAKIESGFLSKKSFTDRNHSRIDRFCRRSHWRVHKTSVLKNIKLRSFVYPKDNCLSRTECRTNCKMEIHNNGPKNAIFTKRVSSTQKRNQLTRGSLPTQPKMRSILTVDSIRRTHLSMFNLRIRNRQLFHRCCFPKHQK